jgi:hypothetical protein
MKAFMRFSFMLKHKFFAYMYSTYMHDGGVLVLNGNVSCGKKANDY